MYFFHCFYLEKQKKFVGIRLSKWMVIVTWCFIGQTLIDNCRHMNDIVVHIVAFFKIWQGYVLKSSVTSRWTVKQIWTRKLSVITNSVIHNCALYIGSIIDIFYKKSFQELFEQSVYLYANYLIFIIMNKEQIKIFIRISSLNVMSISIYNGQQMDNWWVYCVTNF